MTMFQVLLFELSLLRSQLEYWNYGIMGSGKMGQWFVRKIEVGIEVINGTLPFKINLPIFHHSIIPCEQHNKDATKYRLFTISYTISEA